VRMKAAELLKREAKRTPDVRQSAAKRGYGERWNRFRKQLIESFARQGKSLNCAECGRLIKGSPHFDHIVPVKSADDQRFYDEANIQLLHRSCHGAKTRRDMQQGATRQHTAKMTHPLGGG
jgi:5-methylcytosine-specific restriction endonuclease McrA